MVNQMSKVTIHYDHNHRYIDPLINFMERCIEHQEGYYVDEAAHVEYVIPTQTLTVNDEPVMMTPEALQFFKQYYDQLTHKPLRRIKLPSVKFELTLPEDDKPGQLTLIAPPPTITRYHHVFYLDHDGNDEAREAVDRIRNKIDAILDEEDINLKDYGFFFDQKEEV